MFRSRGTNGEREKEKEQKRNERNIGKKDRRPKKYMLYLFFVLFLFLPMGKRVNRVNRMRHKRRTIERKKAWIKYRKYEEYIIIFLHMDWFIAFVPFANARSVCEYVYVVHMRYFSLLSKFIRVSRLYFNAQFIISSIRFDSPVSSLSVPLSRSLGSDANRVHTKKKR